MSIDGESDVFAELAKQDLQILKELDKAHDDHEKVLEIYARRAELYREAAEGVQNAYIRALIYTKRDVILNTLAIIKTQYDIQSDMGRAIDNIISRLENLEFKSKKP